MIADNAPSSTRQVKQAVKAGLQVDLRAELGIEIEAYNLCGPTEDRREGLRAFNEKGNPSTGEGDPRILPAQGRRPLNGSVVDSRRD